MFQIVNRSENWRIAQAFINGEGLKLANKIAERVLKNTGYSLKEHVEYELFWKGYRDYCDSQTGKLYNAELRDRALSFYERYFGDLFDKIEEYNSLNFPKLRIDKIKNNYLVNRSTSDSFLNNLYNTEIDIAIESGKYLLIGEVKHTQTFGADSKLILVHQLVRQFIMASILAEELSKQQQRECIVIPFVIADCNATKSGQIKLLQYLGWLNEKNVILWSSIERG